MTSLARPFLVAMAALLLSGAAMARDVTIGFLSLTEDPRYAEEFVYARVELYPTGDALDGARLGLEDSALILESVGIAADIDARAASDAGALIEHVQAMSTEGQRFILLDLPGEMVDAVAAATQHLPVTLVNTTAPENGLRDRCYANLLHTASSDRMAGDAMVQFLRVRNWQRVLVLVGEEPRDRLIADSFRAAAERMRLTIVDERPFSLSTNPENREENNARLLTGGADYDVIFLADSRGEYGRFLPYATQLPRPVLGSTGLVATDWHWSLERYGAPQVNSRFSDLADGRRMAAQDWSAWMAMKAVLSAYARARSEDPEQIDAYLRSPQLRIDGSKGVQMNFRSWDGQMRQPVMLATHNAVIAIAPLDGFLHHVNTLDTLGTDEAEHNCR